MAFSAEDIVPDSPTNNFCTLNPLNLKPNQTLFESNLRFKTFTTDNSDGATSTVAMPNSGKYYIEVVPHDSLDTNGASWFVIGVTADPSKNQIDHNYVALGAESYTWGERTGVTRGFFPAATPILVNGDSPTYTANAIYQIFYDSDNLKIWMGKNNDWYSSSGRILGIPNFSTDQTMQVSGDLHQKGMFFIIQIASEAGQVITATINFGQDPTFAGAKSPTTTYPGANGIGAFYHQPPPGAKALCTANLPDFTPTVADDTPQDYFKAVLYTGNGETQSITGVGFQPDLVWSKPRSAGGPGFNIIRDSVRGSTYRLITDDTYAELSDPNYGTFSSNGFDIGPSVNVNSDNIDYIAWCWKAGGAPSADDKAMVDGVESTITGDAKLDAGTITPTRMSVNTKAGFSIIKYTGPESSHNPTARHTIPHGLNSEPEFVITKSTSNAYNWHAYHKDLGGTSYIQFNLANPYAPSEPATYNGPHDQNVVKIGGTEVMAVGEFIMYCWHSVEGYSKFGSYEGSSALPFVYTGFRVSFLLLKNADDSDTSWVIHDSARDSYNEVEGVLNANASTEEKTYETTGVDFLSNGFKFRGGSSWYGNASTTSKTVIYMAFAEQPFKYANAR